MMIVGPSIKEICKFYDKKNSTNIKTTKKSTGLIMKEHSTTIAKFADNETINFII